MTRRRRSAGGRSALRTPGAKTAPWKIVAAVAAVVVLIAALAALVIGGVKGGKTPAETTVPETTVSEPAATETQVPATVPADGNPDDVTCKGTYTVTDEEAAAAKDTVVATMGDEQLTNGKLQVYYWNVVQSILSSNYGYSLMYCVLLDYSQPLDTLLCSEDSSLTWQQFFLGEALNYWQMYQSLALEAERTPVWKCPRKIGSIWTVWRLLWRRLPQTTAFPALRNCF